MQAAGMRKIWGLTAGLPVPAPFSDGSGGFSRGNCSAGVKGLDGTAISCRVSPRKKALLGFEDFECAVYCGFVASKGMGMDKEAFGKIVQGALVVALVPAAIAAGPWFEGLFKAQAVDFSAPIALEPDAAGKREIESAGIYLIQALGDAQKARKMESQAECAKRLLADRLPGTCVSGADWLKATD